MRGVGNNARAGGRLPEQVADGPDRKRCTKCGRVKPIGQFHRLPERSKKRAGRTRPASWCRLCVNRGVALYQRSAAGAAARHAYRDRPEVRERLRQRDRLRQRSPKRQAQRKTARAKLLHCRRQARLALGRATDPARRRALEKLCALYDAELARMERR